MSRIGRKPIPLPQGVKFDVKGNTVVVQGPKGTVKTHLPSGVKLPNERMDTSTSRVRTTTAPRSTGWFARW